MKWIGGCIKLSNRLKFKDVDDWTPSSISIVDEPFHPLCKFEVYENDDEFIAKSIEIQNEGEIMVDKTPDISEPEQMVSGPVSFFKDLLNRNVAKSDEIPPQPTKKEEEDEEITNDDIMKAIKSFDERLSKLEKQEDNDPEEEDKKKQGEPVKDAIQKSEGETGEETETDEPSDDDEEESVDDQKVITKSVDPDMARSSQIESEKNFCQRMGRNENGMSW